MKVEAQKRNFVELIEFLDQKTRPETLVGFLVTRISAFGDRTPEEFVENLVNFRIVKDCNEAWGHVLGIARRIFD